MPGVGCGPRRRPARSAGRRLTQSHPPTVETWTTSEGPQSTDAYTLTTMSTLLMDGLDIRPSIAVTVLGSFEPEFCVQVHVPRDGPAVVVLTVLDAAEDNGHPGLWLVLCRRQMDLARKWELPIRQRLALRKPLTVPLRRSTVDLPDTAATASVSELIPAFEAFQLPPPPVGTAMTDGTSIRVSCWKPGLDGPTAAYDVANTQIEQVPRDLRAWLADLCRAAFPEDPEHGVIRQLPGILRVGDHPRFSDEEWWLPGGGGSATELPPEHVLATWWTPFRRAASGRS